WWSGVLRRGGRMAVRGDAPVERGPLHGTAAHRGDERLDLFDRGVLAGVRPGLARDTLLHERPAEVVAAGAERELREAVAELHPRRLQVVDRAAQEEAARGVDAEVAQSLRLRRHLAVVVELGVLPDEAERNELGETVRLLLDAPHEVEVTRHVPRRLDVTVHHGGRRRHPEAVRRRDDVDPGA